MATPLTFVDIGHKITGINKNGNLNQGYRKFRAFFGLLRSSCLQLNVLLFGTRFLFVVQEGKHQSIFSGRCCCCLNVTA